MQTEGDIYAAFLSYPLPTRTVLQNHHDPFYTTPRTTMTKTFIRWDDPRVEQGAGPEEELLDPRSGKADQHAQNRRLGVSPDTPSPARTSRPRASSRASFKSRGARFASLPGSLQDTGSKFPVAMRYSTETTDLIDDRVPQPRGVGLKVFGAKGPKLRKDMKDPETQDFEFNSCAFLELGNARTCRDIIACGCCTSRQQGAR